MLAHFTGEQWGDCSTFIYERVAEDEGVSVDALRSWDKGVVRPKLIAKGDALCSESPCYLAQHLADRGVNIISGVRKPLEITTLVKDNPSCRFTLIWVEAATAEGVAVLKVISKADDSVSFYHAPPFILDNTDTQLRGMADEVVYNITMDHLWWSMAHLAGKHLHETSN